jgi:hypothetical protein
MEVRQGAWGVGRARANELPCGTSLGRCCAEHGAPQPQHHTCAILCSVRVAASRMLATWSSSQRMHWEPSFSCVGVCGQ